MQILSATLVLGLSGFLFALLLAFLSKKLKVEENPLIEKIFNLLPQANCGACGFAGCKAFAKAIVSNPKVFSPCISAGKTVNEEITKALGLKEVLSERSFVAIHHCGAEENEKKKSYVYFGPKTCKGANIIGVFDCAYGCLGLGDCVVVCPVRAITLKDGRIYIDHNICIGCGKCVKSCPRNLFEIVPRSKDLPTYFVACNNPERGANVKNVCRRGCIGCGICTKFKGSPFYLEGNISRIDYSKVMGENVLKEAKEKCPTKCIFNG
ncbi:MAG: RnfABCDGE type electron transport complex subunit B [Candidatus Omnitrophica bacterium]|nr:RnfABCDGE type electron transport complex subunit B [Candidatus Omnitrophota bacterium]